HEPRWSGGRLGLRRVRGARLHVASGAERPHGTAPASGRVPEPHPRAALLLRRPPPRGRGGADSEHLARERRGHLRPLRRERRIRGLRRERHERAGLHRRGHPRRPAERQRRVRRGPRLRRAPRLDAARRPARRGLGLRRQLRAGPAPRPRGRRIPATPTILWDVHTQYEMSGLHLRGLFTMTHIGDAGSLTRDLQAEDPVDNTFAVARGLLGGYGEVAYDVLPLIFPGTDRFLAP